MMASPDELRPRHSYYNGKQQNPLSPDTEVFHSIDPSNAKLLGEIVSSSKADIEAAVQSASDAFPSWSATHPTERARILRRASAIFRERNRELATLETQDTGRPFSETSVVDIISGADVLDFYANLVASGGLDGERTQIRDGAWFVSTKEPIGIVLGVGIWNYPTQCALWKSAPALSAGNCMVYKPSEFTPMHAQEVADIYAEAGLPAGVFNVVYGDGKVGALLTSHPKIGKVSFTGQVSTGQKVAGVSAGQMKYITMELGGKSACIILDDCDLDVAVDAAIMANFYSTGQVCTNGTRVFVPEPIKPRFEKRLLEKMQHIRVGDLMNEETNFGPLSSKVHREKVIKYITCGIEEDKARLLTGGTQPPEGIPQGCENGYWVRPTVFTDCTDSMRIVKEEIFGPVMCILTYTDIDEVIRRANDTSLGLAAGVYGRDAGRAQLVAQRLEAGIVWVNGSWGESPAEMSVGGWKSSGLGVENGRKGLEAWVQNRSILVDVSGGVETVFTAKM